MNYHFNDKRPCERLDTYQVPHLIKLLRQLCGGSIGFDTSRDERTNSKDKLVSYILQNFSQADIDAAHAACVATYGDKRGRRGRRSRYAENNESGQQTFEQKAIDYANEIKTTAIKTTAIEQSDQGQTMTQNATIDTATATDATDAAAQIAAILAGMGNKGVNADQVRAIVDARVNEKLPAVEAQINAAIAQLKNNVRVCEIRQEGMTAVNVGAQHANFPLLLKAASTRLRSGNRLNVWLYGPAGTGKTTAARNVSKALNLAFHFNGAIDTGYKISGFIDANGRTIRTPFREAFEHGGVYLFDEIDGSHPAALLELNAALANGCYAFPDKTITRHPDCVIIAGANTTGLGASLEYVGRMKQDASSTDRFVFIEWQLDEALEASMCADATWLDRVRRVRANAKARGVKGALVTPRATEYGEALLSAGIDLQTVERMTLRKGMNDDQWRQVAI